MQSSGGVAPAAEAARAGAWSVLSGPAGGAVGAGLLARASGDGNALGFDMGGTSCDVCVVEDGAVRRTDARRVDGRTIQLPMVDVHTVGAGGGSIGWRDPGGALRVGPRSAGAVPGPACYGRGGSEPTVTDANLLLGHLAADSELAGGVALDAEAAAAAVEALGRSLGLDRLQTAAGIVRVANQEMVRALRVVTVERGVDPRGFALLPFGGAGPMHAAAIADELGIETILCPRAGGVLSALGLCASERRRDTARTVMLAGAELSAERIAAEVEALIAGAGAGLAGARPELDLPDALRRPGLRAARPRRPPRPTPPTSSPASRRPTKSATATATPTARSSSSTSAWRWSSPAPSRARRAAAARRAARERAAGPLRRGVGRDPGPARRAAGRHRGRRPRRLRAARGDPRPPPGWQAEVDQAGTIVARFEGR